MNFSITFHLDGSGVYFDPNEPTHLDSLLAWALAPRQGVHQHLGRDDVPVLVEIPLLRSRVNGHQVWHASALFPDGCIGEDLQFWRKRFRQSRADLTNGSPNLTNGTYRDWNMPVPLLLARRMVAYGSGSRKQVRKVLREIKYLGKKRAHGHGKIVGITTEEIPDDWSLVKDGIAMRWLPDENGTRLVRTMPPYWNRHHRVRCCEVGDKYSGNGK